MNTLENNFSICDPLYIYYVCQKWMYCLCPSILSNEEGWISVPFLAVISILPRSINKNTFTRMTRMTRMRIIELEIDTYYITHASNKFYSYLFQFSYIWLHFVLSLGYNVNINSIIYLIVCWAFGEIILWGQSLILLWHPNSSILGKATQQ